jgi:type IX secretion system PorP/SprF family membrane protein
MLREKMKRLTYILLLSLGTGILSAQQFPLIEGYNINPFNLSPAYAGIYNAKTLFLDYRSDWTGLDGGPKTYNLSYNDKLNDRMAVGGRFIYDKTDIFKQTLILGAYSYGVKFEGGHQLNFALSAGFYRNSIDIAKYFNDPGYVEDPALLNSLDGSKLKFASDLSVLYRFKDGEAGFLLSNLMFGTVKYRNTDQTYKPLKNYLLHVSYLFDINPDLSLKPLVIFRGGQNIPVQLDLSTTVLWKNRFWANAGFRSGGIFVFGLGGEIYDGIILNYSYNLSSNVALSTFGSHQLSLGIRIFKFIKGTKSPR